MSVVTLHPLVEILARKLSGIEGVPAAEQTQMVRRAIAAAQKWADGIIAERDHYKAVLGQIANDGCLMDYREGDDCTTYYPYHQREWCCPCIARNALEGKP